jgi:MazG family protein
MTESALLELVEVMARLRRECAWKAGQTHESLARYLLEETYETLEAIEERDPVSLREELGDLVLQVVFHCEIAFEEGAFGVTDVLDDLRKKLVRRHPHVFADVTAETPGEVYANWERNKREEKGTGVLGAIPRALPALSRAAKIHRRAIQAGFDFDGAGGFLTKLDEELDELRIELSDPQRDPDRVESELGDVLFMVVSLAQHLDIEPETALRRMLDRFTARFEAMEGMAERDGRELESLSPDEWGRYWEQAKDAKDAESEQ